MLKHVYVYIYRARETHGCHTYICHQYKVCTRLAETGYTNVHTRTQAHLDKQVMNLNADEFLDEGCCRLSI